MLCREIIAVCSQIHTKPIHNVGRKKRNFNDKSGGTNSDHCVFNSPFVLLVQHQACSVSTVMQLVLYWLFFAGRQQHSY
jgi:hypothetical protein